MYKLFLTFVLILCICCNCLSNSRGAYAFIQGDTLVLGNDCIERKILLHDNSPITFSIREKTSGKEWFNKSPLPDLYITETPPTEPCEFFKKTVESNKVHPRYIEATLTQKLGNLNIKLIYKIFDSVPAIACDIYLKGSGENLFKANLPTNPADLKNIESIEDIRQEMEHPALERLTLGGHHWKLNVVEFFDVTDMCNNLVAERTVLPFRKAFYRGNIMFAHDREKEAGLFFLKQAPNPMVQLSYRGADFCVDFDSFSVIGLGVNPDDLNDQTWTPAYGCVTGVYSGGEVEALCALRNYQKALRFNSKGADEMIMMNTWGDRSQDAKVNESFCLAELDAASRLGITHFQIDDGWQTGRSPNSAQSGGSFKDIWKNNDYWKPNPLKYPNGLKPVVNRAAQLGIKLGLWFNPSVENDYDNWEKDAKAVLDLYRDYDIRIFKIDGLQIPNKKSEINLRRFLEMVNLESNGEVIFNLDVTAGRRGGYQMFGEYGNLFVENRYTDWGIYYPYWTLRNLWQLSKYVPAERLQTVFLNKWRNTDIYGDDIYAPANYSFEYIFATAMAGQPLAWFEATGLPESAYALKDSIEVYKSISNDFHKGVILPIGCEPSGESWTGFQSIDGNKGFFLIFREQNKYRTEKIRTFLKEGMKLRIHKILGNGCVLSDVVGRNGELEFEIPGTNEYLLCFYEIDE